MASSTHNPSVLLKRVFNLTEQSSLILAVDSISQTSHYLINEIVYNFKSNADSIINYISFETLNRPAYVTNFVDVDSLGLSKIGQQIQSLLPSPQEKNRATKQLVIVDSLNHIPTSQLAQFISSIASPTCTVVATYHRDIHEPDNNGLDNYPSALELLKFMATSVMDIRTILPNGIDNEELRESLNKYTIPRGLNNKTFDLIFTNRRKSGRSLTYTFKVDTINHTYDIITDRESVNTEETPEMLQDLTTFNLSTSAKQREAKSQVNLPFLEAQSHGTSGGAIVYEFEKDDDYDEEDPYEDPF